MDPVTWKDMFGNEHALINGSGDDVYYITSARLDYAGDPLTQIMSRKAMREFINEVDKDD
ncbi:hypothetical protein [Sporosarcina sp. FSL K6-3457]|uniref:hypothetical protein n=1 Tax=Sporosarcina sp. FSL K6-3457 TaxID=2978204 RepID=UPI0030F73B9F